MKVQMKLNYQRVGVRKMSLRVKKMKWVKNLVEKRDQVKMK